MSDDLDDLLSDADRAEMAAWDADAYRLCVEVPTSKITDAQLDDLQEAISNVVDAWAEKLDGRDWDPFIYGHGPMHRNHRAAMEIASVPRAGPLRRQAAAVPRLGCARG